MAQVTIQTIEVEKIFDALVAAEFKGGYLIIEVEHPYVTLSDEKGHVIDSWVRFEEGEEIIG